MEEKDLLDVFETTATLLNTQPSYIEKDFWVCLVLDTLYNRLPDGRPRLLFKGGTSLSKAFNLIQRFSEDVDIVVYRDGLGFEGERDPTVSKNLSGNKRKNLFEELREACSNYVLGDLKAELTRLIGQIEGCSIVPDESDGTQQSLGVEYPTLYPRGNATYVLPRVKIEAGARSALTPSLTCSVAPYIAKEFSDRQFAVGNIQTIAPQRTYCDKLLILHSACYGYEDCQRLPSDYSRISRHYYDVAMITKTQIGREAMADTELLDSVRNHNIIAFRQAWKRLDKAVPGSIRLIPPPALREVIERDYTAMKNMIFGEPPDFEWIMEQIQHAEDEINKAPR